MRTGVLIAVVLSLAAAGWLSSLWWRGVGPFRGPHTTMVSPEQAGRLGEAIRMYLEQRDVGGQPTGGSEATE